MRFIKFHDPLGQAIYINPAQVVAVRADPVRCATVIILSGLEENREPIMRVRESLDDVVSKLDIWS